MEFIIVPFTDLLDYLESNMDFWPLGWDIPSDEKERAQFFETAAANLCQNLILQSVKHIRNKPDPLLILLGDLGYPTSRLSTAELDHLAELADDCYLDLTMIFSSMENELQNKLEGKVFEMVVVDEDIVVRQTGDIKTERYRDLLRKLKRLSPPKVAGELDDLAPITNYIDNVVTEVFKDVDSPSIRDELKLIFINAIKRH